MLRLKMVIILYWSHKLKTKNLALKINSQSWVHFAKIHLIHKIHPSHFLAESDHSKKIILLAVFYHYFTRLKICPKADLPNFSKENQILTVFCFKRKEKPLNIVRRGASPGKASFTLDVNSLKYKLSFSSREDSKRQTADKKHKPLFGTKSIGSIFLAKHALIGRVSQFGLLLLSSVKGKLFGLVSFYNCYLRIV